MLFGTEWKVSVHGDDTHVQPTGVTRGGDGNEATSLVFGGRWQPSSATLAST